MKIWSFIPHPPTREAFDVFESQSVVAIGWPKVNQNDFSRWSSSYPMTRQTIWAHCDRNENKKTPQATPSFEYMLCDTRPGDIVIAFVDLPEGPQAVGIGVIGKDVKYAYKDSLKTPTETSSSKQPHALESVNWLSDGKVRAMATKLRVSCPGAPGFYPGNSDDRIADGILSDERIRSLQQKAVNEQRRHGTEHGGVSIGEQYSVGMEVVSPPNQEYSGADELPESEMTEGHATKVYVNRFERDPKARAECIRLKGAKCRVCSMDFEAVYGSIGKDFIHVHHLTPLSSIKRNYIVNPSTDLEPVCPNCHAMLHRKKPDPYKIDELRLQMRNGQNLR